MADDYTNTAEHRIPVPAITDDINFTSDVVNLRTRLNQGLRGTAAYNVDGTNYVLAATNAGALLSRGGGYPRGSVIGAASGEDPYVTLYTNTGAALVGEWSIGADDSDSDKLMFSTGTDLSAPKVTLTEAGYLGIGITTPQEVLQVKQAANIDLLVAGASQQAGSVSINAVNDANSANIGLEIRSSQTMFSAGNVAIGNIARTYALNVAGVVYQTSNLRILNSGNAGAVADTAGLYVADVAASAELFGLDEAGNAPQLTPHDPLTGEAYLRSTNVYTGKRQTIWHERVARVVEQCAAALGIAHDPLLEVGWLPEAKRAEWDALEPKPGFFAAHTAEEANAVRSGQARIVGE